MTQFIISMLVVGFMINANAADNKKCSLINTGKGTPVCVYPTQTLSGEQVTAKLSKVLKRQLSDDGKAKFKLDSNNDDCKSGL